MALIKRYQSPIFGNYKIAILKYGLLTGLILSFVVFFQYLIGSPLNNPVSYIEDIFLFGSMLLFTYLYKKKLPEPTIYFKELYILNLGIGIVASLLYGIFIVSYAEWIDGEFTKRCFNAVMRAQETSPEIKLDELKIMSSPKSLGTTSFLTKSVLSVIFALFIALVMRTQKNVIRPKTMKK